MRSSGDCEAPAAALVVRRGRRAVPLWLALGALLIGSSACLATSVTVITTLNIRPALEQLAGPYQASSGDRLLLVAQPATATRLRIERGDRADVVIHDRAVLEALVRQGRVVAGSVRDVAHADIGVIVAAGAPRADVGSDAQLRAVLLAARALTYPDPAEGSIGGNYLAALFERWGVTSRLQPRLLLAGGGAAAGKLVASGRAVIGLNQTAELLGVPGIRFLSPLPPALRGAVVMSAGVLSNAEHPRAARRWITFLASARAARALRAHGMQP